MTPETVKAKVIASEMNRIRDARNDLEKALTSNPSLPLAYRAMLVRCYFAIEDFSHAADRYELLLVGKTKPALRESTIRSI